MHLEPVRTVSFLGHPFDYPLDSLIGRTIAAGREWDALLRPIVAITLPQARPVVCDVGSNIGASCLQILAVKPGAQVVAIEPSDRFRPLLEGNLVRAGHHQVEVAPLLLGRSPGRAWLYNNSSTASVVREEYDGHEPRGRQLVEMRSLDDFWGARPVPDFIKVDTDGFDMEVLRGGEAMLRRHQPVLFFELEAHLIPEPVVDLQWLQRLGYRRLMCFTPGGALVGITADPELAVVWARQNWYCDILALPVGSGSDGLYEALRRRLESG
jgi:FkbM family methyltransferase